MMIGNENFQNLYGNILRSWILQIEVQNLTLNCGMSYVPRLANLVIFHAEWQVKQVGN